MDGVTVERNLGERPHGFVQSRLIVVLSQRYPPFFVWPAWREPTLKTRCRMPDVCVTWNDPGTDVLEQPPFIAIEILSRSDEMTNVLEKLEKYASVGVPNIWLFDPMRKKAYTFSAHCLQEVTSDAVATADPVIRVALDEIFHGL